MERREFVYTFSIIASAALLGCEEKKNKEKTIPKELAKTVPPAPGNLKSPEPAYQKLKLPKEIDYNKIDKTVFQAKMEDINIFKDSPTSVLTFKQTLPNPTIRINNHGKFNLNFENHLELPTIIHWHGLIVPQEMDGHPKDAIPNKKIKHYKYTVNQRAGTYWYHTHPHGRTGKQIYNGLAGFYIIEDENEKTLNLPKGEFELPLMIQDKRFDEEKQLLYKQIPRDNNGLLGDTILVNYTPFAYTDVKNTKYRLRILNASSVRTYKLAFEGLKTFTLIGTDAGLMEEPVELENIVISVAERIDIIVDFKGKQTGDQVTLKTLGFKEASNIILNPDYPGFEKEMNIMQFRVTQNYAGETFELPKKLSTIERLKESQSVKTRIITMEAGNGGVWTMNKKPYDMNRIDQRVKLNTTEVWVIKNAVHMAHPFHMHAVHFQVLDRSGNISFPTDKGYKDTVLVMPNETVRIIVHFTVPGLFLYHCHILEHEDNAMMANFFVEE